MTPWSGCGFHDRCLHQVCLRPGFTALRAGAPSGPIADPDTALAWLVTLTLAEDVWRQVTGTPLTIANYFPRNRAARDLLGGLPATLATRGYSLGGAPAAIRAAGGFSAPRAARGDRRVGRLRGPAAGRGVRCLALRLPRGVRSVDRRRSRSRPARQRP